VNYDSNTVKYSNVCRDLWYTGYSLCSQNQIQISYTFAWKINVRWINRLVFTLKLLNKPILIDQCYLQKEKTMQNLIKFFFNFFYYIYILLYSQNMNAGYLHNNNNNNLSWSAKRHLAHFCIFFDVFVFFVRILIFFHIFRFARQFT